MNNEIVQSILSTYTVLRTYLQVLNSRRVVWLFAILREILNVWLYYVTFVCCLMAISRCRPLPSIVICHAQWLWHRPVDHSAGPSAHLTNRRRCPESTPEARKTSITSPSAIFFGLGSRYPSPDRHLSPSSMRTSQPYMACKLTVPPWNGFLQQASVLKVVQKRSRVSPTIRGWVPPPQKFFFIWKWWVFVHSEWYFMWFRATRE